MPFGGQGRYLGQFPPRISRLEGDRDLWWVVPFSVRYVVGVTGLRLAGKSAVLSYLGEKHGFRGYSLARPVRELASARGISFTPRRNLQDLGDEMRAEQSDAGYLARQTLQRIRAEHLGRPGLARIAVGGFKHPTELDVFSSLDVFHLWQIEADEHVRFTRADSTGMLARELNELGVDAPGSDAATDDERLRAFREHIDRRDRDGRDAHPWTRGCGQWVDGVVAHRAAGQCETIKNNGNDYRSLFDRVDALVEELDATHRRPEL
jgi:dephospho-CoA kinase